jgi:Cu2+-exporting ATPase
MSPEAKFAWVQNLQRQGAKVVMVGDGMNDGPVLAIADVAVAMGQGAAISQTRSDLLLVSNRLPDLSYGVRAAGVSFRLIRENLAGRFCQSGCYSGRSHRLAGTCMRRSGCR